MNRFFGKRIQDLSIDDVESLRNTPESQVFEIKKGLPEDTIGSTQKNSSKSGVEVSDYSKEGIFAELVAFANSEGGWLVIGMSETEDTPHRASKIVPLANCGEIAERLERAAQDWIDPPVAGLQFRGISVASTLSEGVIVCRVHRSALAPHRLRKKRRTQEAYKRVGDQSLPMTMREIQDLTIERLHVQSRTEADLGRVRDRFRLLVPKSVRSRRLVGYCIGAVPWSDPLSIDRPYLEHGLFDRRSTYKGIRVRDDQNPIATIDSRDGHLEASEIRPLLRGGQATTVSRFCPSFRHTDEWHEDLSRVEVFEIGTVGVFGKTTFLGDENRPHGLSLTWIVADLANTLRILEKARLAGGNAEAEYALEMSLHVEEVTEASKTRDIFSEFRLGLLTDGEHHSKLLGPDPLILPRYRVGRIDEFPETIRLAINDIYNAVGEPHPDRAEFLPFEL